MVNIFLRYIYIVTLTLTSINSAYSQGEANNWLLGANDYYLSFNNNTLQLITPTVVNNPYVGGFSVVPYHHFFWSGKACASISDKDGNLLLYSNGEIIYNYNYDTICLHPTSMYWRVESAQHLFIPKPGKQNRIYFFASPERIQNDGIRFYEIDMNQNAGAGAAIIPYNQVLQTPSTQKVTAVYHANGKDIWVLTHQWGTNNFTAFLVTKNGINMNPVVTSIGSIHQNPVPSNPDFHGGAGQMKFNPQGTKLAVAITAINKVEIYNFNNTNGGLSSLLQLNISKIEGLEFSSDGTLLYLGRMTALSTGNIDNYIYQLDLKAGNEAQIINSLSIITDSTHKNGENYLQLAPNGKIYITGLGPQYNNEWFFSAIESPNTPGMSCNFNEHGFIFPESYCGGGLQTVPSFFCSFLDKNILFADTCFGDTSLIFTQTNTDFDSVRWVFNDPILGQISIPNQDTISHYFPQPGNYEISLNRYRNGNLDVVKKVLYILPSFIMDLGPDSMICQGSSVDIALNELGCSFNWVNNFSSDTVNSDTISITQSGLWWPVLTNFDEICGSMDTIEVDVFQDLLNLGADNLGLCSTTGISLDASVNDSTASIFWNTGDTSSSLFVNEDGVFDVTVQQGNCTFQDTISLAFDDPLTIALQDTLVLCDGMGMFISAGDYNASYVWSNGETNATIWVQNQDLYAVTVTNGCGDFTDSIQIITLASPSIDLGSDSTICESDSLWLSAYFPQSYYQWSTAETSSTILASQETSYSVTVSNHCGDTTDAIFININTPIILNLGNDTTICEGDSISLDVGPIEASVVWSTGEFTPNIQINTAGYYSVEATNQCNHVHDTILIETHQAAFQFAQDSIGIDTNQIITLDAGSYWQSYEWSTGETTQTISIGDPGYFWVLLTDSMGCTASDTVKIYRLVIAPLLGYSPVRIFPNPANGVIFIDGLLGNEELFLYDVVGNLINTKFIKRSPDGTCMLTLPTKGVYLLLIRSENHSETFKLIRE